MNRQPRVGTARSAIEDPHPVKAVEAPKASRVRSLMRNPLVSRDGAKALHTELTELWV